MVSLVELIYCIEANHKTFTSNHIFNVFCNTEDKKIIFPFCLGLNDLRLMSNFETISMPMLI